jgi:hypothetical protein
MGFKEFESRYNLSRKKHSCFVERRSVDVRKLADSGDGFEGALNQADDR